jgi:hypothetical protein
VLISNLHQAQLNAGVPKNLVYDNTLYILAGLKCRNPPGMFYVPGGFLFSGTTIFIRINTGKFCPASSSGLN